MALITAPANVLQRVVAGTKHWTAPWTTAVYGVIDEEEGRLVGSGTYLTLLGDLYLLTAAHVVDLGREEYGRLARRSALGATEVLAWHRSAPELDLAIAYVGQDSTVVGVDVPLFDIDSSAVDSQHLFVHGFPGTKSHFTAFVSGVVSESVPYLTYTSRTSWSEFNQAIHFAIEYPKPEAQQFDEFGRPITLPDAHGMSGCAVWNLGSDVQGTWQPSACRLVGVAHHWSTLDHSLVVTRVEQVRAFLLDFLRQRYAFFRWRDRGSPWADALPDWLAAESALRSL